MNPGTRALARALARPRTDSHHQKRQPWPHSLSGGGSGKHKSTPKLIKSSRIEVGNILGRHNLQKSCSYALYSFRYPVHDLVGPPNTMFPLWCEERNEVLVSRKKTLAHGGINYLSSTTQKELDPCDPWFVLNNYVKFGDILQNLYYRVGQSKIFNWLL